MEVVMGWELWASPRQGYLGLEKWAHGDSKLDCASFSSDPPTLPQVPWAGSCYAAPDGNPPALVSQVHKPADLEGVYTSQLQ